MSYLIGWQSKKIKNLSIKIIDGDRSSKYPKRDEFQSVGVLFLNTTNIIENRLDLTEANFVSNEKFSQIKKGRLQPLDIVMTTRGSVGKAALFKGGYETGLINAQMLIIRSDGGEIDQTYLFYWLISENTQQTLQNFSSGSAQPQIPIKDLQEIEIIYPSLKTQRKIGSILSAYDDLIENNTQRIKALEAAAQALYREWFVEFRFPGHESVEFVPSELGDVPEGWEVTTIGEVVELAYGKSLTEKTRIPGDYPVYGSAGIVGYHNQYLIEGPSIIVGRKGNVGSIFWSDKNFYPIDTVYYVQTEVPLHYIFYNFQQQNFINNDAAVPGLNRNQAYSLLFLLPESGVLEDFVEFVDPIFQQLSSLDEKNGLLREARDLLLPRLISGELDVSELEIDLEGMVE